MNESQRARALRLITALEHANPYNYERAAAALLRELAAEPVAAPRGDEPTMPINVVIGVPTNWESRLDMQWIIEREIKADRWSWRWPSAEPERVPLTDELSVSPQEVTEALRFVRTHLYAAQAQAVPGDDSIIMRHVYDAYRRIADLTKEVELHGIGGGK